MYTRFVIFNKRRCGETARLLLTAFSNRPRWEQVAVDQIVNSLEPLEWNLLQWFALYMWCMYATEVRQQQMPEYEDSYGELV